MDICNAENSTPLHIAFLKKDNELVDMLLSAMEKSSNCRNVKNKFGLTTLHIACARDNTKVMKKLIKSFADLKDSVSNGSKMWKGFTAMHFAAEFQSLEAMKILVSASSNAEIEKKNGNGQTALQIITKQMGNLQAMHTLLSLDIHSAIERQNEENIKIFMKRGAKLSETNIKGMTPLHLALYTEKNGERNSLVDSLYEATTNKESNPKDNYNLNYLHVACTRNDVRLVKQLLEKKADVNSKITYSDKKYYNFTPLHFATLYENLEVVRLLLDQGADVNACDGGDQGTPLHMALDFGNEILIDVLLSSGANPKAVTPIDKQTTLHCLVRGYLQGKKTNANLLPYVEKLIMKFGVDVNAKDHDGDTALHTACGELSEAAGCIKLLLEFGADINAENDAGDTPFMTAIDEEDNWHRDNVEHYVMLYHHVQKLKAFGLEVNEKNERCCEQLMKQRVAWKIEDLSDEVLAYLERERLKEVTAMRNFELFQHLSFYELLMLEPEKAATYIDDGAGLNANATTTSFGKVFPIYGYLIKLQQHKIQLAAGQLEASKERDQAVKRQRCE